MLTNIQGDFLQTLAARLAARSRVALLALVPAALLLAPGARAAEPEPVWSLGSGLGYIGYSSALASLGGCCNNYYLQTPSAPQPQFGIERRISATTAVFLDLAAGVSSGSSGSTVTLSTYGNVATSSFSWSAGALLGVRRALTGQRPRNVVN